LAGTPPGYFNLRPAAAALQFTQAARIDSSADQSMLPLESLRQYLFVKSRSD